MKKRLDSKDRLTELLTLGMVASALVIIFLKVLFF